MVIFLSILVYFGTAIQKAPGAVGKWDRTSKNFLDFLFFWPKAKILHPGKLKFQNDPKRVCPNTEERMESPRRVNQNF